MKIADLFFEGRLDDGKLLVDAKKSGDKAGQTLGQRMSMGIKKGSSDLVTGIKLGAGIAAFGGLTMAIGGTVSALGDAIQAAREDEESQSRLGAALKANIANWDGNTTAIEATIASRQRLGFTDEEQRTSLALLVVATNDVTTALEIQRAAMDLARLKGISLEAASEALIKVEGGQFRALKALGIQLPKNATATEALAAVQKAAAGSAEDFAETSEGRLLASQIKVGEAMEKLGYILLPVVTAAMIGLADVAAFVAEGIAGLAGAFEPLFRGIEIVSDGLSGKLTPALIEYAWNAGLVEEISGKVRERVHELSLETLQAAREVGIFTDAEFEAERALRGASGAADATASSFGKMEAALAEGEAMFGRLAVDASRVGAAIGTALQLSMRNAQPLIKAEGNRLGASIAQGIREKRDAVDQSWQDLLDAIHNGMTPAAERAKLVGQLVSTELIWGLKSKDPAVRAQAAATKQTILDRLAELGGAAKGIGTTGMEELRKALKSKDKDIRKAAWAIYKAARDPIVPIVTNATTWGENAGDNFADGLRSRVDLVASAAGAISKALSNNMRVTSPAKEGPLSTLGGPEGWGARIATYFAKGLRDNLPDVAGALGSSLRMPSMSLGSAVPSMAMGGYGGASVSTSHVGGVTNNYYNTANVTGLVKATDPLEIARQLGRSARSGEFRPVVKP